MKDKLNLQEIVDKMSRETGASKKDTETFLRSLFDLVYNTLLDDKIVKISGLGTFKLVLVNKRESVNVNTKEKYEIPAHYKLSFIPDGQLKEMVNEPFSAFDTVEIADDTSIQKVEIEEADKAVSPSASEEDTIGTDDGEPVSEMPDEKGESEGDTALLKEVARKQKYKVEAVVAADTDQKKEPTRKVRFKGKRKTKRNRMWMLIGITIAMLLFVVAGFWKNYQIEQQKMNENEVLKAQQQIESEQQPVVDTVAIVDNETVTLPVDTTALQPVQEEIVEPADQPKPAASGKMKVIDKVIMKPGLRLTLIAEEYYQSKVFWVYLYEANKTRITNPNNIPVGTVIEIPAPEEYGINVNSGKSVREASALGAKILSSY